MDSKSPCTNPPVNDHEAFRTNQTTESKPYLATANRMFREIVLAQNDTFTFGLVPSPDAMHLPNTFTLRGPVKFPHRTFVWVQHAMGGHASGHRI